MEGVTDLVGVNDGVAVTDGVGGKRKSLKSSI